MVTETSGQWKLFFVDKFKNNDFRGTDTEKKSLPQY